MRTFWIENYNHFKLAMSQLLDTPPWLYALVAGYAVACVFAVLEIVRVEKQWNGKSFLPFSTLYEWKNKLKFFRNWKSELWSRMVYIVFIAFLCATLLIAFISMGWIRNAGICDSESILFLWVFAFMFMLLVFPTIAAVFYIQERVFAPLRNKFVGVLYILFLIVFLVCAVYFTFMSDYSPYNSIPRTP